MRIWHQTAQGWREVRGPADIHAADKVLRVEGTLSGRELARWSYVLGVFVCRGGEIRRLDG